MEYTIKDVCRISGQSARTIRFYDKIGLLTPEKIRSNGYRIYTERQLDILQQILFYRELDMELEQIKKIIYDENFDAKSALNSHIAALRLKRERIDGIIASAEKTLLTLDGGYTMSQNEKFEAFKKNLVDENMEKYGNEIVEKYGQEAVDKSHEILLNMTEKDYKDIEELTEDLNSAIKIAFEKGDPAGEEAQLMCQLHKKWLTFYWGKYEPQMHMGVAEMYVCDERFTAYYDKIAPGCAVFLRDAVKVFVEGK